ncbi:MAG: Xaa-Pro peptidase family protein [Planctomycetota bacterium]
MKFQFDTRVRKLRNRLKGIGVEAVLITNQKNVRYLCGFSGSSGYLIVSKSELILLSDTRYEEQIASECPQVKVDIRDTRSTLVESAKRVAKAMKLSSIGFEAQAVSKALYDQLSEDNSPLTWVATSGTVEEMRAIKDRQELAIIRQSIRINERAFETIVKQLTSTQTEKNIAHNLEHQLRHFGGTRCAFDPIVGVGPRAALPHGQPSSMQVQEHPILLIDWGTEYEGYLSDLTRIVVTGKINAKFRKMYQTVLKAQKAAIETMKPGIELAEVDRAARAIIEKAGYGKQFGHGLGHSFGLEIHEQPFMSPVAEGTLKAGMVITVEPGIYVPGFAGVRIEDDVLVTRNGFEILSNLPKELDECTVDLVA